MSEPFIGEIRAFGFNFAPRGWAMCNGQLLSIAQNTALFSLLGTTYGGNGQTTFALPNLQGRVPLHFGQGPGLSPYALGEVTGVENTTLLVTQMPAHTHSAVVTVSASDVAGAGTTAAGNLIGVPNSAGDNFPFYAPAGSAVSPLASASASAQIGVSGSSQPVSVIQPVLALNYCIALEGIFPSRN
jgi:microcystin-dependent protein